MREPYLELYVHLVWGTWDRAPLLTDDVINAVHACIRNECMKIGAKPVAIGGISDHVHLLAKIPATMTVAELAKQVKGSSSHMTNRINAGRAEFKWQGAYAALSVSRSLVPKVRSYILNQKAHHETGDLDDEMEGIEEL